jgi:hypothetical protein
MCKEEVVAWLEVFLCTEIVTMMPECSDSDVSLHTRESVKGSQIDIKRKTCDNRNCGKKILSRHDLHQHWYTCPIASPMRRHLQHTSLLAPVSATSVPPFQPFHHQRNACHPVVNCFTRQTLPTTNRKHFFYEYPLYWVLLPNRTLLFGSIPLKHGRYSDYWNQPLNMRMRIWYLDSHEAGLCCYLVIHTENLLRLLRLFYFHLWPIYCLSLAFYR